MKDIFLDVNRLFLEFRDKNYADFMTGYMKNKFKFLGVKSYNRRKVFKHIFPRLENDNKIFVGFVLESFEMCFREFHYLAIDYLIRMKRCLVEDDITFIEKVIILKPWWDTVDLLASNLVGYICEKYPKIIPKHISNWINHKNIWLKRSSIIFQLRYKQNTDLEFFEKAIKDNSQSEDFFIKKAIGWALREYAKTDEDWVRNFVNRNHLSNLSVKEAMKYIGNGVNFHK